MACYCVYVDNELEDTDLTKEEALDLESEIMEEDPEAIIRVEPMGEGDEEEDLEEDDSEEEEEEN